MRKKWVSMFFLILSLPFYQNCGPSDSDDNSVNVSSESGKNVSISKNWSFDSVGSGSPAGLNTGLSSATFELEVQQGQISGASDTFYFMNQAFVGDFKIQAKFSETSLLNGLGQAGIMLRRTLKPDAQNIFLYKDEVGKSNLGIRTADGDSIAVQATLDGLENTWFQMIRFEGSVYVFDSANGIAWRSVGQYALDNNVVFVGFALASGAQDAPASVIVENISGSFISELSVPDRNLIFPPEN